MKKVFQTKKVLLNTNKIKKNLGKLKKKKNHRRSPKYQRKKPVYILEIDNKTTLSQTYVLYDENGMAKPTFVSELNQEVNIFSEFTAFCKNR